MSKIETMTALPIADWTNPLRLTLGSAIALGGGALMLAHAIQGLSG